MTGPGNDLERELKQALRRKEPPPGFAARVMASLPEEREGVWARWFRVPALRWATAFVLLVGVAGGGVMYRQHQQEEEQGRLAKRQLMMALRITGAKLQLAQQRLQQIGNDRSAGSHEMEKQQ